MCSGIAHDPLQRDIFTPLFFGAQVCIPTDADIGEPGQLARWMAQHRITAACLTPAMGQLLVSAVSEGAQQQLTLPALRSVFFVGDLLIKRDVHRLQARALSALRCSAGRVEDDACRRSRRP
jgi:L-aminoadipate-semialdehyde dehydrogenase